MDHGRTGQTSMVLLKFKVLQQDCKLWGRSLREICARSSAWENEWETAEETLFTLTGKAGSHLGTALGDSLLQGTDALTSQSGPP